MLNIDELRTDIHTILKNSDQDLDQLRATLGEHLLQGLYIQKGIIEERVRYILALSKYRELGWNW